MTDLPADPNDPAGPDGPLNPGSEAPAGPPSSATPGSTSAEVPANSLAPAEVPVLAGVLGAAAMPGPPEPPGTGALSGVAAQFLRKQIDQLEPLEYLLVGVPRQMVRPVEVARTDTGSIVVRVPPLPTGEPLSPQHRTLLAERGFSSVDPSSPALAWEHAVADSAEGTELAAIVLRDVFAARLGELIDLFHGSHRMEHERRARLEAVRAELEPVLVGMLGTDPERDPDGDYIVPIGDIDVIVAPRSGLDGIVVVRVLAITNVGVEVNPELGLFLARLNFGLMFGRFALDVERKAVWFDETLLGGHIDGFELQFTVGIVATTARSWDDQLKQLFGGLTQREAKGGQQSLVAPSVKPGQGGYL